MALPARKLESEPASRSPRLSVVPQSSRGTSRRSHAHAEASCRSAFHAWTLVLVAIALFGLGRVALSAQAAEASLEVGRLRNEIKAERFLASELEVQRSALASPNRIQTIAGATMGMAGAGQVCYITLDEAECSPQPSAALETDSETAEEPRDALGAALETVMNLAAGEARVLLVGDVGLASTP